MVPPDSPAWVHRILANVVYGEVAGGYGTDSVSAQDGGDTSKAADSMIAPRREPMPVRIQRVS